MLALLPGAATAGALPTGAAGEVSVEVRGDTLAIEASRGAADEVITVDYDRANRELVVGPDVRGKTPARCRLDSGDGLRTVHCPVTDLLILAVRTRAGDDRVALGANRLDFPGNFSFASRVLLATVDSGGGDDSVVSAAGFSKVLLRAGDDRASSRGGEFFSARGGTGNDTIRGGAKTDDELVGSAGNDVLRTGAGGGSAIGRGGRDRLVGGGGKDNLVGGSGGDRLRGAGGEDFLDGGAGDDRIEGGGGEDLGFGGYGADVLRGGTGLDWMDGGLGRPDRCAPGPGARLPSSGCELSF